MVFALSLLFLEWLSPRSIAGSRRVFEKRRHQLARGPEGY